VTVEMHLRSARQKLGARTLHEAIARALIFGEISRS
jgi:DNA-binding CsgD family transcriptional regulator